MYIPVHIVIRHTYDNAQAHAHYDVVSKADISTIQLHISYFYYTATDTAFFTRTHYYIGASLVRPSADVARLEP